MNLTPIFKLLSDETRIRVIMLLSHGQLCVCEMTGILSESQPKISKVLSKLRDMDLVADERREKFVFYTLKENNDLLNAITAYITQHAQDYPIIQDDLQRLARKEDHIDQTVLASLEQINEA